MSIYESVPIMVNDNFRLLLGGVVGGGGDVLVGTGVPIELPPNPAQSGDLYVHTEPEIVPLIKDATSANEIFVFVKTPEYIPVAGHPNEHHLAYKTHSSVTNLDQDLDADSFYMVRFDSPTTVVSQQKLE
tara:strand:+ start:42 stop:431 length:390 start_codon:yes stop_codon:yes gene_type:complete